MTTKRKLGTSSGHPLIEDHYRDITKMVRSLGFNDWEVGRVNGAEVVITTAPGRNRLSIYCGEKRIHVQATNSRGKPEQLLVKASTGGHGPYDRYVSKLNMAYNRQGGLNINRLRALINNFHALAEDGLT